MLNICDSRLNKHIEWKGKYYEQKCIKSSEGKLILSKKFKVYMVNFLYNYMGKLIITCQYLHNPRALWEKNDEAQFSLLLQLSKQCHQTN